MNFLIIHPFLSVSGGAEATAAEIVAGLLRAGHSVTIFVAEPEAQARSALYDLMPDIEGARLFVRSALSSSIFARLRKPPALLGYALLLREISMRRFASKADIVFSTYGECHLSGRLGLVAFVHYPIFSTRVDASRLGGRLHKSSLLRRAYTTACRRIAGYTDWPAAGLCLTNSNWTAGQIANLVRNCSPKVVYCSVRSFVVGGGQAESRSPDRPMFRVVCLGRLVGYKGHDLIARAVSAAARVSNQRAEVLFVGRGTDTDVANIEQLGDDYASVRVLRNASRREIGEELRTCDIGISAFAYEHFGIAVAELQAAGLPVLVPDGGGQTEIVPDARFIYGSESELIECLARLMSDRSELAQLRVAVDAVRDRFTAKKFHSRVRQALEERFSELELANLPRPC